MGAVPLAEEIVAVESHKAGPLLLYGTVKRRRGLGSGSLLLGQQKVREERDAAEGRGEQRGGGMGRAEEANGTGSWTQAQPWTERSGASNHHQCPLTRPLPHTSSSLLNTLVLIQPGVLHRLVDPLPA